MWNNGDRWHLLDIVIQLVTWVTAGAAAAVAWWTRRNSANNKALLEVQRGAVAQIEKLDSAVRAEDRRLLELMNEMSERLAVAEESLKYVPTARDLQSLQSSIAQLSATVARNEGSQTQLVHLVGRINTYLMERGQ
jgi:hypothetical protein